MPATWEDTYEGYHLHMFEKDNTEEILYTLMNCLSVGNPEAAKNNYLKLSQARYLCYGQCWTTVAESDAFWRIYSYNRMAVRIETDRQQIEKLLVTPEYSKKYSITIDDIQYDLDPNGQTKSVEKLMEDISATTRVVEPYFHKRKAFEHEHERRVILLDKIKASTYLPSGWAILKNLQMDNDISCLSRDEAIKLIAEEISKFKSLFSKETTPNSIEIPIPDIGAYIKSVMVHPQAEKWIVDLVESICKKNGLTFAGQSQMYAGIL